MSITCPRCRMESHHPKDVEHRWCANCNQFHYAIEKQEPIYFNAIVGELQAKVRAAGQGAPFALHIEQFKNDDIWYWRAFLKLGNAVWKRSYRNQSTPTDALRELSEIMDADL